jgi:DNA repair protein RAD16
MDDYQKLAQRVSESAAEVQLEMQELEPEELVQKEFRGKLRSAPPGLNATLLPFQREGMSWMYCQEVGQSEDTSLLDYQDSETFTAMTETKKCGILADEMGMGKTVQTISLILDHRPILQHCLPNQKHPPNQNKQRKVLVEHEEKLWEQAYIEWKHEMNMCNVSPSIIHAMNPITKTRMHRGKKRDTQNLDTYAIEENEAGINRAGARAGTLVICPVAALTQWKNEIEKFCEPGSVSVIIYHGPDRERLIPRHMFRNYDVVITTYQVLEADFRKMTSPNRVKCPNCGGKFKVS